MKIKEGNYLQELRKGNQDTLSFVITKYGGLVMSIIQKHLYLMKDKQEECFDDVFINVWNHIECYDEKQADIKNWILLWPEIKQLTIYVSIDESWKK